MKIRRWSWRLLVACVGVLLLTGGPALARNASHMVHVLGDSLSDPGNLYALTGFWPLSPPYAQRNSNGPVWTEYLAEDLGVEVDSRAVGGAFSGPHLVDGVTYSNFNNVQYPGIFPVELYPLPGVQEELDALLDDYPDGLNPRAIYVVWAGGNDFFLGVMHPEAMPDILAATVNHVADTICQLGAFGARHFVVGNMPDIGLTPFAQEVGEVMPGAPTLFTAISAQYNAALAGALSQLEGVCAESIVVFDAYQALNDLANAPGEYGLTNVSDACLTITSPEEYAVCAAPDEYLFWDPVHPTTRVHEIFSGMIRETLCQGEDVPPGLRWRAGMMPPPAWHQVCFGGK